MESSEMRDFFQELVFCRLSSTFNAASLSGLSLWNVTTENLLIN